MKSIKKMAGIVAASAMLILLSGCFEEPEVVISELQEEQWKETSDGSGNGLTEINADENNNLSPQPQPTAGSIMVHICGAVNWPGVYELTEGDRVYHAIERAGGFTGDADEDYLNQAGKVSDGIRIYIPTKEETSKMQVSALEQEMGLIPGAESDGLVNINTATQEELCSLPGIGEGKAKSIIAYRQEKGGFSSIEDIMNVEGIKEGLFVKIRDKITVS